MLQHPCQHNVVEMIPGMSIVALIYCLCSCFRRNDGSIEVTNPVFMPAKPTHCGRNARVQKYLVPAMGNTNNTVYVHTLGILVAGCFPVMHII